MIDEFAIELRRWALETVTREFAGSTENAILEAQKFFDFVKSGELPDKTDQQ
jgi:hypothetical protein